MNTRLYYFLLFLVFCLPSQSLGQDVLTLSENATLYGDIHLMDQGVVVMEELSGEYTTVHFSRVRDMHTQSSFTVVLDNKDRITGTLSAFDDAGISMNTAYGGVNLARERIQAMIFDHAAYTNNPGTMEQSGTTPERGRGKGTGRKERQGKTQGQGEHKCWMDQNQGKYGYGIHSCRRANNHTK